MLSGCPFGVFHSESEISTVIRIKPFQIYTASVLEEHEERNGSEQA